MPLKSLSARSGLSASEQPLRILAIGGGTGLSTLLKGLKHYARPVMGGSTPWVDITAVVTVTDDGGSSGRLRRDFDVLPPGDIRNCMVALSEDEALLSKLFQYRFSAGRGLKGHSFGNLFLTALTQMTGDFAHAIAVSSEVLASAGRIYPSTASNVVLKARLADGSIVSGETIISRSQTRIRSISIVPRKPQPLPETLEAIRSADLITFGPGSLFTSIIPNLLVDGIPEAIEDSLAVKAYFCNLMWQPGETTRFRASDHAGAIQRHAGRRLLDYIIVNTGAVTMPQRTRYAEKLAQPVEIDLPKLRHMGLKVIQDDLLLEAEKVRHDPHKAAHVALQLALEGRRRREAAGPWAPPAGRAL
jgi:uncharacterized cofD-like protein